jgi:hypothetical protein
MLTLVMPRSRCRTGCPGHDDFVEAERLVLEREIRFDFSAGRNRDFAFDHAMSDTLATNRVRARRNIRQRLRRRGEDADILAISRLGTRQPCVHRTHVHENGIADFCGTAAHLR